MTCQERICEIRHAGNFSDGFGLILEEKNTVQPVEVVVGQERDFVIIKYCSK